MHPVGCTYNRKLNENDWNLRLKQELIVRNGTVVINSANNICYIEPFQSAEVSECRRSILTTAVQCTNSDLHFRSCPDEVHAVFGRSLILYINNGF